MSLGWLSESYLLPRKRKVIEGVSQNSLVNLKAAVFDVQQQAKKHRTLPRPEVNRLGGKNKGVETRIQRDIIAVRNEKKDPYENLVKKSQLYEKLLKGEVDFGGKNEEKLPLVDFEMKRLEEEEEKLEQNNYDDNGISSISSSSSSYHDKIGMGFEGGGDKAMTDETKPYLSEADQFFSQIMKSKTLTSNDMRIEAERINWEKQEWDEMIEEKKKEEVTKIMRAESQKTKDAREKVKKVRHMRRKKNKRRIEKIKAMKAQRQKQEEK